MRKHQHCVCSWAAYVAGALVVLMHEEGHVFDQGLSLLISSQVPDGKGVSSSAALEAAAMTAISSAYGIKLPPQRLAALCQLVLLPICATKYQRLTPELMLGGNCLGNEGIFAKHVERPRACAEAKACILPLVKGLSPWRRGPASFYMR